MHDLKNQQCIACMPDSPMLTTVEMADLVKQLPDWEIIEINGVKRLVREFKFRDFIEALAFTNSVAEIAESEGHHPAILTEWGSVEVSWWSHKIKGLHQNDFVMAAKTDAIYISLR
jgi:4a-hydroxytetrahydrobiopterin dehydratase